LSACTTAFGGVELLDESVHIASALQLAGFTHVIGTLWPIADSVAPEVAEGFYREVRNSGVPALALHNTVRQLRNRYPDSPSIWASHLHFGP
jgi:CHAT domain-containing protein